MGVGGVAGFWLPAGLLAGVLGVAAAAFTPVLVRDLWQLGRRGWLTAFVVWVGGAAFAGLAVPIGIVAFGLVLVAFYSYTWVLKLAVGEWLREAEEAAAWERESARWRAEAAAEAAALAA